MILKRTALFGALVVIVAACGGDSTGSTASASPATAPAPTTTAPASDAPEAPASTEAATATTIAPDTVPVTEAGEPVPADAPVAPDFELALGEGGTFSLSAEQKPVYLVFWAEW